MSRHIKAARGQLADLASLSSKTEAAERRILQRAESRLAAVGSELERLRPGVEGAPDSSQDRYMGLIDERAQLNIVIAKARAALGA